MKTELEEKVKKEMEEFDKMKEDLSLRSLEYNERINKLAKPRYSMYNR